MSKVLIVDDEPGLRYTLAELLRCANYEVMTAEDSSTSLKIIDENQFDVAIVDIILPEISGLEILKEIRDRYEDVPVIMITGKPNVSTFSEIIRSGAYDYLTKPVMKEQLLHAVSRAIERRTLLVAKQRLEIELKNHTLNLEKEVTHRTAQLESIIKKLAESEQIAALGLIAAQITHEVRNPLTGLQLYAFHLQEKILNKLEPKEANLLDKLCSSIDHLIKTVDRILSFERPIALQRERLSLNAMCEDALALIEDRVLSKSIQVVMQFDASLPDCFVDAASMKSALLNIFVNSIEALSDNGRLIIRTERATDTEICGPAIYLTVADTGCGMTEEQLKKVFNPFYTTKSSGLGLGMTVAQKVVTLHEGTIKIDSRVGHGTTVKIAIPLGAEK